MRIAVFGAGGAGGYFGGRLAQAGEDVVFIARGEHLQALRTHGLRVDSVKGNFILQSVQATDDPAQVGVVDVVLLGVKAWQVPEAAQAMRPLVGPETFVVPAAERSGGACSVSGGVGCPARVRWFGQDYQFQSRAGPYPPCWSRALCGLWGIG